jgi:hypothetical protein
LKSDIGKFDFNRVKDYIGIGKYHKLKGKGWSELQKDIGKFDMNRLKEYIGLGKKVAMSGKGWDDFTNFFKSSDGIKNLAKQAVGVADAGVAGLNKTYEGAKKSVGLGKKGCGEYGLDKLEYLFNKNTDTDKFIGRGTDEILGDLKKADLNRLKAYIGIGKHGAGTDEILGDLKKADLNRLKAYIGIGKFKVMPDKAVTAEELKLGGHKLAVMPDHEMMSSPLNPAKPMPEMKAKGKRGKGKLVPKSELHSSTISGFGKSGGAVLKALKGGAVLGGKKKEMLHSNDIVHIDIESPTKVGSGGSKERAQIVKRIMKERGVKMVEASKIVKAEGLYKAKK